MTVCSELTIWIRGDPTNGPLPTSPPLVAFLRCNKHCLKFPSRNFLVVYKCLYALKYCFFFKSYFECVCLCLEIRVHLVYIVSLSEDAALGLRLHCVLGSILAFLVSTHRSFTFFWTKTKYSVIRITVIYLTNPTEYFLGYFHLHVHIINMFVRNRMHSIQECSVLKFWFIFLPLPGQTYPSTLSCDSKPPPVFS